MVEARYGFIGRMVGKALQDQRQFPLPLSLPLLALLQAQGKPVRGGSDKGGAAPPATAGIDGVLGHEWLPVLFGRRGAMVRDILRAHRGADC